MKFAVVKVSCSKTHGHTYAYHSTIMETGGSPKWTNTFATEIEMVTKINSILARQHMHCDVRFLLGQLREDGHYFYDLDLTLQEASSLGWRPDPPQ
jgi:hypothetical protein